MSATKLFVHRRDRIPLREAVESYSRAASEAVALLYSPQSCVFASLSSGCLRLVGGDRGDEPIIFEARVFCWKGELRWLNDPGVEGCHRAVILSEEDLSGSLGDGWIRKEVGVIAVLDQTYLLWGEGTGKTAAAGWSQLGAARVGALPIPVPAIRKNQHVLLETREYLEAEHEHGNVQVCAERLCGLKLGEVNRG